MSVAPDEKWLEITVASTHETQEDISALLIDLGASGTSVVDKADFAAVVFTPDSLDYAGEAALAEISDEVTVTAWFMPTQIEQTEQALASALTQLERKYLLEASRLSYCVKEVVMQDWQNEWKKYFEILHLADNLVVVPSWLAYQPKPDEHVITLDPGSAFGTGQHETTSLVAQTMLPYLKSSTHVLDLGTGSGILALFAAKTSKCVEAIDLDPTAVRIAQENAHINELLIEGHQGTLADARRTNYDLILANIIPDVLIPLADDLAMRLATDGELILSGILAEYAPDVELAYEQANLELEQKASKGDWVCLRYKKARR